MLHHVEYQGRPIPKHRCHLHALSAIATRCSIDKCLRALGASGNSTVLAEIARLINAILCDWDAWYVCTILLTTKRLCFRRSIVIKAYALLKFRATLYFLGSPTDPTICRTSFLYPENPTVMVPCEAVHLGQGRELCAGREDASTRRQFFGMSTRLRILYWESRWMRV